MYRACYSSVINHPKIPCQLTSRGFFVSNLSPDHLVVARILDQIRIYIALPLWNRKHQAR
jgi:hypothetical protein